MPGPNGIVHAKNVRHLAGERRGNFRTHTKRTVAKCRDCGGRVRAKTPSAHKCKGK